MTNMIAFASGMPYSRGVFSVCSGLGKINHSVMKGSIFTKDNGFGVTSFVGDTQLDGEVAVNQAQSAVEECMMKTTGSFPTPPHSCHQ
jgi:hypothetical protein